MKRNYSLLGLNSRIKNGEKLAGSNTKYRFIGQQETPNTYSLLDDPDNFYRINFNQLSKYILREKRLLEFETPNRAKVTHEYDFEIEGAFDYDCYYFLFNPKHRLSWLKIRQKDTRVLIAKNDRVKLLVRAKLENELQIIAKLSRTYNIEKIFEYIWNIHNKYNYPCFIRLIDLKESNFLLETEFFDSIIERKERHNWNPLSPLDERVIKYEYIPSRLRTSWLYIKAPENFVVSISDVSYQNDYSIIDTTTIDQPKKKPLAENADPEILSLAIVNVKDGNDPDLKVKFKINISVPMSVKVWFITLYYLTLTTLAFMIFDLINNLYFTLGGYPLINYYAIESIINKDVFSNINLAIIAAIIATRGWMISEETILKRFSINLTWIMILLILVQVFTLLKLFN